MTGYHDNYQMLIVKCACILEQHSRKLQLQNIFSDEHLLLLLHLVACILINIFWGLIRINEISFDIEYEGWA